MYRNYFYIDRVEIVLYQKPRDIARSTEGKLLFRDLKPYLQIFGYHMKQQFHIVPVIARLFPFQIPEP